MSEPGVASHDSIVRALDAAARGLGRITPSVSVPVADARSIDPLTLARLSRARGFALARVDCNHTDAKRPLSMVVELVRALRTLRGAAGANPAMSRYLDGVVLDYVRATGVRGLSAHGTETASETCESPSPI